MKPAAVAATLLLHATALGVFYHYSSTEPAAYKGQPTLVVAQLEGPAANLATAQPPAQTFLASPARTPAAAQSTQSGNPGSMAVSIPADYAAANLKPVYPLLSRKQAEQGTVILRVLVRADGSAGDVLVQQSSGYPLLDESALSAVRQWRFHPASVNHRPIAEWYQVAIPFKLQQ